MRLRNIEIFHAVMRTGSVSGAAEWLHLSQSAASKALAQAEHALGLTLFERVRGRLIATREAEQLFGQTSLLFAQADTVQRMARNLRRTPGGHLRIGCLPSLGIGLMPGAIADFRQRCPGVSVDITTGNGVELAEQCLSLDIDIALVFEQPVSSRLRSTTIGAARAVHLEAGAPAAQGEAEAAVVLATLDRARWIGIGGSDPFAQRIREAWVATDATDDAPEPIAALETRTYAVACALAAQGLGFALVDEFTAAAMGSALRIRPVTPEVSVAVVALQEATAQRSEALVLFLEAVGGRLRQEPAAAAIPK
ncbi:LysR family transcriptional regulator [Xylophilus rhododendri]|uniref:LysR family transcriptional regulator n=1 Tax=Xylophilus rhododendri TaxID=2697032 RepID=A0A857J1I3_9BURK|nr:LysR substrate-binding domain-containing protein [Xylophilus rhododendri]QHI97447.1 LysR family transcriptional regulator [Xylophilus rhododendri]